MTEGLRRKTLDLAASPSAAGRTKGLCDACEEGCFCLAKLEVRGGRASLSVDGRIAGSGDEPYRVDGDGASGLVEADGRVA